MDKSTLSISLDDLQKILPFFKEWTFASHSKKFLEWINPTRTSENITHVVQLLHSKEWLNTGRHFVPASNLEGVGSSPVVKVVAETRYQHS